jgi:hypothetical protein
LSPDGAGSRLNDSAGIAYYEVKDPEFSVGVDAVWLESNENPALKKFTDGLPPTIFY